MLGKCEADLAAANVVISKNTKTINTLTKHKNDIVVSTKAARDAAREAKDYAKGVEKSSLETTKKLEVQLQQHMRQYNLHQQSLQIRKPCGSKRQWQRLQRLRRKSRIERREQWQWRRRRQQRL
jgi:hypothetical protein